MIKIPILPAGKNTDKEKNPFHKVMKMGKVKNPQTGHIAISKDMTATTPTTAPTGISFGLYYSIEFIP